MFSSVGHFRNVPCPRQSDCSLPSCVFLHALSKELPNANGSDSHTQEYDPFSAGHPSSPPTKRRRLDTSALASLESADLHLPTIDQEVERRAPDRVPEVRSKSQPIAKHEAAVPRRTLTPAGVSERLSSQNRPISPPPVKPTKSSPLQGQARPSKPESLTPRNVAKAPAMLKTRLAVVQKLHEQMKIQNDKLAKSDVKLKSALLDHQELITFALDEEEAATQLEASIYKNAVSQLIMRIKKMTTEEWTKKVLERTLPMAASLTPSKPVNGLADLASMDLPSLSEQVAVLRHLRTPLEGLESYGYVSKPPTAHEIASAQAGVKAANGFETCDRCGTRFQVFPGRDGEGRLTSGGGCRYHWARANRQARSESVFPCCNKPEGSDGCMRAETHVFAVKSPNRLASILQFEHTPEQTDVRPLQPVSYDCEMGYTTLGMEAIRVTAVSWPGGRLLFDVFVRTYGEILDLNTRFSGVTPEAYGSALPYTSDSAKSGAEATEVSDGAKDLFKVDSPAAARQLLFDIVSPETPLIGHAIENDLNVLRIIHPFVVDTVLLYPHPRGLPVRFSLKILSQKYLSRGIQRAGAAGHDSKEDAVATGDLVTQKVAERWKAMKHEGWRFEQGLLTAPDEREAPAGRQSSML
jgi:DNA polymerase III epsilon subunit-like protein